MREFSFTTPSCPRLEKLKLPIAKWAIPFLNLLLLCSPHFFCTTLLDAGIVLVFSCAAVSGSRTSLRTKLRRGGIERFSVTGSSSVCDLCTSVSNNNSNRCQCEGTSWPHCSNYIISNNNLQNGKAVLKFFLEFNCAWRRRDTFLWNWCFEAEIPRYANP